MVIEFAPLGLEGNGWSAEDFLGKLSAQGFQISPTDGDATPLTPEQFPGFIKEVEKKGGTNLFCETLAGNRYSLSHRGDQGSGLPQAADCA